jgi:biopolymer transport protein ExbD
MLKILNIFFFVATSVLAIFASSLKKKNEALQEENKSNNSLIKSVKNAEEIKAKNSKLSKSELIAGL